MRMELGSIWSMRSVVRHSAAAPPAPLGPPRGPGGPERRLEFPHLLTDVIMRKRGGHTVCSPLPHDRLNRSAGAARYLVVSCTSQTKTAVPRLFSPACSELECACDL